MKTLKKILSCKVFLCLLAVHIVISLLVYLFVVFTTKPADRDDTYQVRLYSPSVSLEDDYVWGRKNSHKIIKIKSGEYELKYANHVETRERENTDENFYQQLQMEDYLDITYIISKNSYVIVEIHGNNHTYYTFDDYNEYYETNYFWGMMCVVFFNVIFIVAEVWTLLQEFFGIKFSYNRLRKKHPTDKHVYTDEENEFSPYKQKLLDEKHEE